jgi:hypothetical protein
VWWWGGVAALVVVVAVAVVIVVVAVMVLKLTSLYRFLNNIFYCVLENVYDHARGFRPDDE